MSPIEETVPCCTCATPTPMLGTKRCNACWELERRLRDYLRKGGVNALRFIEAEVGAVMGFKVTVRKELP